MSLSLFREPLSMAGYLLLNASGLGHVTHYSSIFVIWLSLQFSLINAQYLFLCPLCPWKRISEKSKANLSRPKSEHPLLFQHLSRTSRVIGAST